MLAAAAECSVGTPQAAPVDAARVLESAVDETVTAAAAGGVAGPPAWVLDSSVGLAIQGYPWNLAAGGSDWAALVAGHTETG